MDARPCGIWIASFSRLHIAAKFTPLCKRKVPAEVPAQTVEGGSNPVEKDMLGFGLTVNVTQL